MNETGQMIAGITVLAILLAPAAIIIFAGIINAFDNPRSIPAIIFFAIAAVSGFSYWLIKTDQESTPAPHATEIESSPDDCERYPGPYGC